MMRMRVKTITVTRNNVGMSKRILLMMYWCISPPERLSLGLVTAMAPGRPLRLLPLQPEMLQLHAAVGQRRCSYHASDLVAHHPGVVLPPELHHVVVGVGEQVTLQLPQNLQAFGRVLLGG